MPLNLMTTRASIGAVILRGVAAGGLLLAAFLAGFFTRGEYPLLTTAPVMANPPRQFSLLPEVQHLLEEYYLRELPPAQEMEYAAIRGMLGTLHDPYTFFVDPPVAQSESDVLAGQYGGIGVQIRHAADGRFVLYPFPGSPAAEAGIEDGDVLLAVNGRDLDIHERIDVVDQALRGEVSDGNGVTLRVLKRATNTEEVYDIAFAVIEVPSVLWRALVEDTRFGYIQILRFTSRTPEEVHRALEELRDRGVQAWILDVRDNSGGLLQEAVDVADEFLDSGIILYEEARDEEQIYRAEPGGAGTDLPLVILVNRGTASAAELVAGALRDNGRGILVGQTTYGKGSVQLIFPLSDGSSVHITSAEWYTPARTQLARTGLEPDISMIPAEDGRDVELDEAIRYLQQQLQ